jgi:hypothetical protein
MLLLPLLPVWACRTCAQSVGKSGWWEVAVGGYPCSVLLHHCIGWNHPCPLSHRSIYFLISLCLFSVVKQTAREIGWRGCCSINRNYCTELNGSRPKWSNFSLPPIFILGGLSLFAHMIKKAKRAMSKEMSGGTDPLHPAFSISICIIALHVSFPNIITTHHHCFCMNLYTHGNWDQIKKFKRPACTGKDSWEIGRAMHAPTQPVLGLVEQRLHRIEPRVLVLYIACASHAFVWLTRPGQDDVREGHDRSYTRTLLPLVWRWHTVLQGRCWRM